LAWLGVTGLVANQDRIQPKVTWPFFSGNSGRREKLGFIAGLATSARYSARSVDGSFESPLPSLGHGHDALATTRTHALLLTKEQARKRTEGWRIAGSLNADISDTELDLVTFEEVAKRVRQTEASESDRLG
jgi:hypothetical protein